MASPNGDKGPGPNIYKTSGMLILFSALLLVEGMVRITNVTAANHGKDWAGQEDPNLEDDTFPPVVLLIGAVLEVVFALAGLFRGLAVLMFDYKNATLTQLCIGLMLTGWYTFTVWVFAGSAYHVDNLKQDPYNDLSRGQYEGVVTLGILGSIAYCAAIQGGQVFFAWQLWKIEQGDGSLYTESYYVSRLIYYSTFALIGGVAQLAIGIFIREEIGEGKLAQVGGAGVADRVAAAPFFIVYPGVNIATGALVTLAALFGYCRAFFRDFLGSWLFPLLWAVTLVAQVGLMAAVQLGLWGEDDSGDRTMFVFVSGMVSVLSLALSVLPPYMDAMSRSEDNGPLSSPLKKEGESA